MDRGRLNDTNISVVFHLTRVSVMGNNFTYNSSAFGRGDVYTTIRTYLSTGKSECVNESAESFNHVTGFLCEILA